MRQSWEAKWVEEGKARSTLFTSSDKKDIAVLTFMNTLTQRGETIPEQYSMERVGPPFEVIEPVGRNTRIMRK